MKRVAIQDASILIDLLNTGLFDYCLALEYHFSTTRLILEELYDEQVAIIQPHISSGKFEVIDIVAEELTEIQAVSLENSKLSLQDWSAIFYAQKRNALLLSGDRLLRKLAESKAIEVSGIIWILDQLIADKILSNAKACSFIKDLLIKNKRLPKDECEQRMKIWCE